MTEGVAQPAEKDHRLPLPQKGPKPSTHPSITLKEKKTKEEEKGEECEVPPLRLKPKAKGRPRRSRSRSGARDKKDKKKRRSPSPSGYSGGGDLGVSSTTPAETVWEEEGDGRPPGDWEARPEIVRRPKSPDLRYLVDPTEDSCGSDQSGPTRTGQPPRKIRRSRRSSRTRGIGNGVGSSFGKIDSGAAEGIAVGDAPEETTSCRWSQGRSFEEACSCSRQRRRRLVEVGRREQ